MVVVVVVGLKLPEGPSLLGWIVMMAARPSQAPGTVLLLRLSHNLEVRSEPNTQNYRIIDINISALELTVRTY